MSGPLEDVLPDEIFDVALDWQVFAGNNALTSQDVWPYQQTLLKRTANAPTDITVAKAFGTSSEGKVVVVTIMEVAGADANVMLADYRALLESAVDYDDMQETTFAVDDPHGNVVSRDATIYIHEYDGEPIYRYVGSYGGRLYDVETVDVGFAEAAFAALP